MLTDAEKTVMEEQWLLWRAERAKAKRYGMSAINIGLRMWSGMREDADAQSSQAGVLRQFEGLLGTLRQKQLHSIDILMRGLFESCAILRAVAQCSANTLQRAILLGNAEALQLSNVFNDQVELKLESTRSIALYLASPPSDSFFDTSVPFLLLETFDSQADSLLADLISTLSISSL